MAREKPKGWVKEPVRHGLAAKGIKTGHQQPYPLSRRMQYVGAFTAYPDEATNYALDWVGETVPQTFSRPKKYEWDGYSKSFHTSELALLHLYSKKMDEKLNDMIWELKHGERADWDIGMLEGLRDKLYWDDELVEELENA